MLKTQKAKGSSHLPILRAIQAMAFKRTTKPIVTQIIRIQDQSRKDDPMASKNWEILTKSNALANPVYGGLRDRMLKNTNRSPKTANVSYQLSRGKQLQSGMIPLLSRISRESWSVSTFRTGTRYVPYLLAKDTKPMVKILYRSPHYSLERLSIRSLIHS
jgi:hypothetical protein